MAIATPGGWLTARRLRAHGTILAVCLWSFYVWNLATPGLRDRAGNLKGTDFLHFYTLGSLALAHDGADLYDINAQAALAEKRVPQAAGIRYLPLYPPQVSVFFAPPAQLSYAWALGFWWGFSAVLYGACCYCIWRVCPNLREDAGIVFLLALAFPGFFHLIAWGQTSALALVCFTVAFLLLRGQREILAGVALGCLVFKPQLGISAAILFLVLGRWKILAGAIPSAAAQLSTSVIYYGLAPIRAWVRSLWHVDSVRALLEPKPYQTHCLRTFWSMLLPWPSISFTLYVLSAIFVMWLTISCWKRGDSAPLALRYSALLLSTVLVAPHLTVYDLVILSPALILLADWIVGQQENASAQRLGTLLYFVYALPLIGPFSRWTHLQLSVVAMMMTIHFLWGISSGSVSAQKTVNPGVPATT